MDIIQGIVGIVALVAFAKLLGFDIRDLLRRPSGVEDADWMDDEPNSTMSVTREVLAEKLEQSASSEFRAYTQNWSRA
jgi:hypothetical protein